MVAAYTLGIAWEQHGREIIVGASVIAAMTVIWKTVIMPIGAGIHKVMNLVDRMLAVITIVEQELLSDDGWSVLKEKIEVTHERVDAIDRRLHLLEGEAEGHIFRKGGSNVRHSQ